jgi:hypothetical protein
VSESAVRLVSPCSTILKLSCGRLSPSSQDSFLLVVISPELISSAHHANLESELCQAWLRLLSPRRYTATQITKETQNKFQSHLNLRVVVAASVCALSPGCPAICMTVSQPATASFLHHLRYYPLLQ